MSAVVISVPMLSEQDRPFLNLDWNWGRISLYSVHHSSRWFKSLFINLHRQEERVIGLSPLPVCLGMRKIWTFFQAFGKVWDWIRDHLKCPVREVCIYLIVILSFCILFCPVLEQRLVCIYRGLLEIQYNWRVGPKKGEFLLVEPSVGNSLGPREVQFCWSLLVVLDFVYGANPFGFESFDDFPELGWVRFMGQLVCKFFEGFFFFFLINLLTIASCFL